MKKGLRQKILASICAGALMVTGVPASVYAEGETALENGETLEGPAETIQLSGNIQETRDADFNEGWKFYLGKSSSAQNPVFDDSSWENVTLPHDFSITQGFTTSGEAESGFLPGGTGWYRKSFVLSESYKEKRIVLNFDGVYSDAYVYVNGTLVGENHYGYTSFAFDITDELTCDGSTENVIAVEAINNIPSSRWYSGSGIYRDVTLTIANPVHVAYRGTQVTTPGLASGDSTVHVAAEIENDAAESETVVVKNTVYDKDGTAVSETVETSAAVNTGETVSVECNVPVTESKLWSLENPNLYYVQTEVYVENVLTDSYDTDFGFRYISFDSNDGFYLNGEAVKLNGVCMHHDQGALGSAAYYDAMYRQLSIMKDMGANAIRTSHNPADEDFIDICNELGLLVVEEAFDGWSVSKNGNSNDFGKYFQTSLSADNKILGGKSSMTWAEFAIKEMVKRDRNDPSVILWSLGNEIQEGASAASDFPTIAQNLISWIQEEDTTRKATIGSNQRTTSGVLGSVHSVVADNGGVVGFNYASASELQSLHNTYGIILSSETSSAVNSRGIYSSQASAANVDGKYHLTSYDTSKVSWGITAHDSMYQTLTQDFVAGEFVWTGFDYLGEPTPWNGTSTGSVSGSGAIPNSSYFGIVETTGFEKDTYYLYRSQWNQAENTLHLVTAWDTDNMLTTGEKTPVVIYSNAPKVELYRNGTLIGTATRTVYTTSAGHQYYTYSTASNDTSVCTAVSSTGSASLYATFNVTYEAGTISAKAYDENNREITDLAGNTSVSTPESASQLDVQVNKTEISADGSSLAYVTVDVEDAKGVLDTTAVNAITFNLSGDGEIVGVDNGDQATLNKYQQSSVLSDSQNASIQAYAGKALVIVRSTKNAGDFTLTASASGLTGGSVTVKTTETGETVSREGLVSYELVRDYTIKAGSVPAFRTTAAGLMADGSSVEGTITWDTVDEEKYNTPGDYSISGKLVFEGQEPINVTCRLHVIGDIIALRNISAVTGPGAVPTLPNKVTGVLADGTLSGEFDVLWPELSGEMFANTGDIVEVEGTAVVFGTQELPVTASVRVAEAVSTESKNVAPDAAELTQDIDSSKQSDNLASIVNGTTKPGDNTEERWSNWNNRTTSDTAVLTFRWDTAQLLSGVNLYYYYDSCAALPESVSFEYSLDGQTFTAIECTAESVDTYSLGEECTYTFAGKINPVALRIILKQQGGTTGSHCVALTEAEIMTFAGKIVEGSSAALSGILVDDVLVDSFDADTMQYEANGSQVTAEAEENIGITILPLYENVVRILTISEDGSDCRTYEVQLSNQVICRHENTVVENASEATCTEDGYSGDTKCADCGELIEQGKVIPATGHSYDDGVITKEATETEEGIKTYTCTKCGETKTEAIPVIVKEKKAPTVTVSAKAVTGGKIALTGKIEDIENIDNYYSVTGQGLVYMATVKLGTHNLTVNTAGRTRVTFSKYKTDGSFTYNMTPAYTTTRYTVRAYITYVNNAGKTVYVYSEPMIVSYDKLNK